MATLLLLCLSGLCACRGPAPEDPQTAPAPARTQATLTLTPQEVAALGIVLTPAAAARYVAETDGFGQVLSRDVIAQPLTDLLTARAAMHQSQAVQTRMQRLAGTPGADSAAARDGADHQLAADDAALQLAQAKASAALGRQAPWTGDAIPRALRDLAAGRIEVLRVTFPQGSFAAGTPRQLRVTRFGGGVPWRATAIWSAPADPLMPGRSYFAIVEKSDLAAGERLLAQATETTASVVQSGVFIPASALVITADRYWLYERRPNGAFVRTAVDISHPQPGGYFIGSDIEPGDAIVTAGAGLLLARDMNSKSSAGAGSDPHFSPDLHP